MFILSFLTLQQRNFLLVNSVKKIQFLLCRREQPDSGRILKTKKTNENESRESQRQSNINGRGKRRDYFTFLVPQEDCRRH